MIDLVNCHKRQVIGKGVVRWTKKSYRSVTSLNIPAKLPVISLKLSLDGVWNVYLCWPMKSFADFRWLVWSAVSPRLPMSPKARGLAQHGGPPGWLEESDPAGVILYSMDGPYQLPFFVKYRLPWQAAQLRADGISNCCYIVNVYNHLSWATSRKEGMAWYSSRLGPCRLSVYLGRSTQMPHHAPPCFHQSV